MGISNIKQNLVSILSQITGVSVSFDYATAAEAENGIVIDALDLSYNHDLDMGWHKELKANAVLVTKTDDDLDSLVDALENLDNASEGCVRDIMLESVSIDNRDSDVRVATAVLSCLIWDVATSE